VKLENKKIALCATRKVEVMIEHITKLGGKAYIEDIVRMSILSESEIIENIKKALKQLPSIFYYTTGVGTDIILEASRKAGIYEDLANLMKKAIIFSRGYKTKNILIHNGFQNFQNIDSTKSLINILRNEDMSNTKVFVQMYGEELPELEDFLSEKGAKILKVWTYKYKLDIEKSDIFIKNILEGFYDAIVFTSAYQVDYIFNRAKDMGLKDQLSKALNEGLVIVAIGKNIAQRLYEHKVMKVYYPEKERLHYALTELEKAFENG